MVSRLGDLEVEEGKRRRRGRRRRTILFGSIMWFVHQDCPILSRPTT